jgi:hypothetical protein
MFDFFPLRFPDLFTKSPIPNIREFEYKSTCQRKVEHVNMTLNPREITELWLA